MADGADLRSTQASLMAMRPRIAFGAQPTGIDKAFRSYFFGLAPVPSTDDRLTMGDLIGVLFSLSPSELAQVEQLMIDLGTRADCDEGINVARNVVRQKPQAG
jgi:hypothetical protein